MRCVYNSQSTLWELLDEHGQAIADVTEFLAAICARGLSVRTIRAYAFDLLLLYRWLAGRSVNTLTRAELLEFIKYQRSTGSKARSINRRLATCRAMFRFLTDDDIPQALRVSLPGPSIKPAGREHRIGLFRLKKPSQRQLTVKVEQRLVEPLTKAQIQLFLHTLRRYRDRAIVYLMLLCGLRSREVLELKLQQTNLIQGQLLVLGKGNKERMLPLPDEVMACLTRYLQFERPEKTLSPQLFVVLQGPKRGEPMTPAGLRSLFRHRRSQPLLAAAHPHRWRHTFGTEMARHGVRLHTLQKLMGHGDMSSTMQYISLSMADIADEYKRAVQAIEARLRDKE
jgi:site-specific recombinase XerD